MSVDVKIEKSWKDVLQAEWDKPYFLTLTDFVREEYGKHRIYPSGGKIFEAFRLTPFDEVKVVILGQDPYHGAGQANGLCFSVNEGVALPPSLQNIFKEIKNDLGVMPQGSDLSRWARQGVLLLNSTLTVRDSQAGSHQGRGWEQFTDSVISALNEKKDNLVFILWGSYAIRKGGMIDRTRHLVLESPHPSPLSAHRGFFGNGHFSKTNEYLTRHGKSEIDWR